MCVADSAAAANTRRLALHSFAARPTARASSAALTVAYVSGDLTSHPVGLVMLGVLTRSHRTRTEPHRHRTRTESLLYSLIELPSDVTVAPDDRNGTVDGVVRVVAAPMEEVRPGRWRW
jgi:hypothetical protein